MDFDEEENQHPSRKLLLTNDNYMIWSAAMEAKLDLVDALDIVLGEVDKRMDKNELLHYNQLNRRAYAMIFDHLHPYAIAIIVGQLTPLHKRNGRALWKTIQEEFMADDFVNQSLAFSQFAEVTFNDNMDDFVKKLRTSIHRMKTVGAEISNQMVIILALSKLPDQFKHLKREIDYKGKGTDFLLKNLQQDAAQDKIAGPNQLSTGPISMSSLYVSSPCSFCKKTGHSVNQCWSKHPDLLPASLKNQKSVDSNSKQFDSHFVSF